MVNIYTAPGSKTEERHALNNTRAEMQAGLGPCQIGIETDQLKLGFKDHLGNYHSSALEANEFKVKAQSGSTAGGYLENVLVPASGGAVSLSPVGDTIEADVGVDNATIEKNANKIRLKDDGITDAKVATANKDGTAGVYSMRSIGTGALQACSGADARLSDARAPTAHKTNHEPGGSDAMAVDAAAVTGSLRTVGTGALQACAGNDSRLSDARTPVAHAIGGAEHTAGLKSTLDAKLTDATLISTKQSEISALTAKASPTGSDILMIEDYADANSKKKIAISTLPVNAHNLAGSEHNADTITNLNSKLSDGDVLSTKTGEVSAMTAKSALVAADLFMIEDSAASYAKKKVLASDMFGNIYQVKKTYINTSGITTAIDIYVDRAPFGMTLQKIYVIRKGGTGATINALNAASTYLASNFSITSVDALMDAGTLQNAATSEGALITLRIATIAGSPTQIGFFLLYKRVV
jgi:hypothetical protein